MSRKKDFYLIAEQYTKIYEQAGDPDTVNPPTNIGRRTRLESEINNNPSKAQFYTQSFEALELGVSEVLEVVTNILDKYFDQTDTVVKKYIQTSSGLMKEVNSSKNEKQLDNLISRIMKFLGNDAFPLFVENFDELTQYFKPEAKSLLTSYAAEMKQKVTMTAKEFVQRYGKFTDKVSSDY